MTGQPSSLPVAVVIAAFNRAGMVEQAIESALDQRPVPPAEVIVVDDGSTDDTRAVAERTGVRVLRHDENRGAAVARNTGIAATGQPWVAPLDSDDRWRPNLLATLWPLREGYGFVAGASVATDPAGQPISYGGILAPRPIVLGSPAPLVYPENFVAASGVLIDREAFTAAGGYRAGGRQAEDLDLWIRMLQLAPGLCVPEAVTEYTVHDGQKSRGGAESRAAVIEIIDRYRDEPWWSDELRERRLAVMAWDELREALRAGDRRSAVGRALWLSRRRVRRDAIRRALARRRAGRRRIHQLGLPPL